MLAVAGSGKTTHIIKQLSLDKRSLIITYTNNNIKNLRDGIIGNFEYFPDNITLTPYFTFLYSFCVRPFLAYALGIRGINWDRNPNRYINQTDMRYFVDNHGRVYSNRLAKLLEAKNALSDVNARLEKYFDDVFIDEIQDFAGNDFNFLESVSKANIEITFVGDFYQHTFDTSRDGNVNSSLHEDFDNYKDRFEKMGITVDCESLSDSYRCSPTVCQFIKDSIGINICSHKNDATEIHFLETQEQADKIYQDDDIVKLFYKEHYKYGCHSRNWGDCKGEDRYTDVCVVLNRTTLKLFKESLDQLNPQTRNKLYVACSRANNDLYFVSDEFYSKYKA